MEKTSGRRSPVGEGNQYPSGPHSVSARWLQSEWAHANYTITQMMSWLWAFNDIENPLFSRGSSISSSVFAVFRSLTFISPFYFWASCIYTLLKKIPVESCAWLDCRTSLKNGVFSPLFVAVCQTFRMSSANNWLGASTWTWQCCHWASSGALWHCRGSNSWTSECVLSYKCNIRFFNYLTVWCGVCRNWCIFYCTAMLEKPNMGTGGES